MKIDALEFDGSWMLRSNGIDDKNKASLVLVFGDSANSDPNAALKGIHALYPNAHVLGASSAGSVLGTEISDAPFVATAVQFEKGHVEVAYVDFAPGDDIALAAERLTASLPQEGLKHVFVLSDGLNVNGSELVSGLSRSKQAYKVTGGMAGDGDRFQKTWVIAEDSARDFRMAAVGFYGKDLIVSSGVFGGWSDFGSDRTVTRSEGNVLYELDGEPALDLYKKYLGPFASELPLSGMRFPLNIRQDKGSPEIIRTLLAIDEETKSITFAGDIPEGHTVRLMQPKLETMVEGAAQAAQQIEKVNDQTALGLVVSCTGRRIVLHDLVEDELEVIQNTLGKSFKLAGFYSYGEIAGTSGDEMNCHLHNQTMTLTGIYEL